MDQVVGGCHVLAELLLQAEEAQGRGGVGVSLGQATAGRRRHSRAERGLCSRRQRGWGLFLQAGCRCLFTPQKGLGSSMGLSCGG